MSTKVSGNVRVFRALRDTEAAYLGGFLDGEGTLSIYRTRKPDNRAGVAHVPRMSVANTHLGTLQDLQQTYGGRIAGDYQRKKLGHKPCYTLTWLPTQIRWLLPQVTPWLRVKKQQADVLRRFLDLKPSDGKNLSDKDWVLTEECLAEIRGLNHRGAKPYERQPLMIRRSRRGINQWTSGHSKARMCQVAGCDLKHYANGYCKHHHHEHVVGFKEYDRDCAICGNRFVARRSDTECCSKRCGDRNQYLKNQEARNAYKREWRARQKQAAVTQD